MKNIALLLLVFTSISYAAQTDREQDTAYLRSQAEKLKNTISDYEAALQAQKDTIKKYKEETRRQQIKIDQLEKSVENLLSEITRLANLCREKGINTIRPTESNPSDYIVYKGKERSKKWFENQYAKFADKLICSYGKFYDVRALPNNVIKLEKGYRVLSVLSGDDVLIHNMHTDTIYHVANTGKSWVDDEGFPDIYLVRTGTYNYMSAIGAGKVVLSHEMCEPITKELFAGALLKGFELADYKKVDGKMKRQVIR